MLFNNARLGLIVVDGHKKAGCPTKTGHPASLGLVARD